MKRLLGACVLGSIGWVVAAQPATSGVQVEDAWVRRAPMLESTDPRMGTGNSAAYVKLVNPGTSADALVAATSDVSRVVEVHETYQEAGLTKMRPVPRIDVLAGGRAELKPGGYHLMLLDLKRDLLPGQEVRLTLEFSGAGKIPVTAQVR